jgi:hypothetical protein
VLVVQVDVVGAEPLQRSLDCDADARGAAVEDAGAATGVRDDAELRRQHDLVAAALDGPADQLLVVEGAADLGGHTLLQSASTAHCKSRFSLRFFENSRQALVP